MAQLVKDREMAVLKAQVQRWLPKTPFGVIIKPPMGTLEEMEAEVNLVSVLELADFADFHFLRRSSDTVNIDSLPFFPPTTLALSRVARLPRSWARRWSRGRSRRRS